MEIYVNYLAIEVTRRCNMKCEHCLRGDAQNLDISTAVLSGIAKHIHPASVIFTGGEPSLNVPAIKRYFELAERYDTMPAAFYVATNGATSKEQYRRRGERDLQSQPASEESERLCEERRFSNLIRRAEDVWFRQSVCSDIRTEILH